MHCFIDISKNEKKKKLILICKSLIIALNECSTKEVRILPSEVTIFIKKVKAFAARIIKYQNNYYNSNYHAHLTF